MRCAICNKILSKEEVKFNNLHQDFDPCSVCLEIIQDVFEPLDDREIDRVLSLEEAGDILYEESS